MFIILCLVRMLLTLPSIIVNAIESPRVAAWRWGASLLGPFQRARSNGPCIEGPLIHPQPPRHRHRCWTHISNSFILGIYLRII